MVRKYQYALHTGTKYRYYFMELLWESRMYAREDIDCDVKLTSQGGSQSKPCESHGDAAKEQSDRPGLLPTRGHFLCLAGVHSLSTVTLPHGNPLCCPVCIPFSGSLPLFIPRHPSSSPECSPAHRGGTRRGIPESSRYVPFPDRHSARQQPRGSSESPQP